MGYYILDCYNNLNSPRPLCFVKIKMVKTEDIIFWILIVVIVGIAIWLLFGSPSLEAGLISLVLFVAGSELLIWRKIFSVDKNVAISFIKMKNNSDNKYNEINNKLEDIKNLIK